MKYDYNKYKSTNPTKVTTGKTIGSLTETQCDDIVKAVKTALKINDTDPNEFANLKLQWDL